MRWFRPQRLLQRCKQSKMRTKLSFSSLSFTTRSKARTRTTLSMSAYGTSQTYYLSIWRHLTKRLIKKTWFRSRRPTSVWRTRQMTSPCQNTRRRKRSRCQKTNHKSLQAPKTIKTRMTAKRQLPENLGSVYHLAQLSLCAST